MLQAQEGRSAPAKKDGSRLEVVMDELELSKERANIAGNDLAISWPGIKRAVFTLPRAKGHMDVKTCDRGCRASQHGINLAQRHCALKKNQSGATGRALRIWPAERFGLSGPFHYLQL